jgi:hypothetical protein
MGAYAFSVRSKQALLPVLASGLTDAIEAFRFADVPVFPPAFLPVDVSACSFAELSTEMFQKRVDRRTAKSANGES